MGIDISLQISHSEWLALPLLSELKLLEERHLGGSADELIAERQQLRHLEAVGQRPHCSDVVF